MPIYEYRCADCKRRVSIFFPSFSAAETRIASGEVRCPRCSGANLTRLMSRAYGIRSEESAGEDLADDTDSMFAGLDEDDPRSVAKWARHMKDSMGGEMDMGPEFDSALDRIEAGEDPDKVMEDMDPEALGGPGMDDEGLGDGYLGDDF